MVAPSFLAIELALVGLGLLCLAFIQQDAAIAPRVTRLLKENVKSSEADDARYPIEGRLTPEHQATLAWIAHNRGWTLLQAFKAFAVMQVCAPVLAGAMLFGVANLFVSTATGRLILLPVTGCAGFVLGRVMLERVLAAQAKRRTLQVARDLPEAMDLLLISISAGIGLQLALERVSAEIAEIAPDVAEELGKVNADLAVLADYDRAFENLASRIPATSISAFVAVVRDSLKHGSPIRSALQTAVDMERQRSLIRIDQLANEVPAKITTLTMALCFPPLLIVIGGPPILGMIAEITK